MCFLNRVLTGRCHSGDENGKTWFEDAELEAVDESGNLVPGVITVSAEEWSEWSKESSGQGFDALNNHVIVGREHKGDENGLTRYATAIVRFNGKDCMTCDRVSSSSVKESKGIWCCSDSERVMTGRHHTGDENGMTRYQTGLLKYKGKLVKVVPYPNADMCIYESQGRTVYPKANLVIIGIKHSGDENGVTTFIQGYIVADK